MRIHDDADAITDALRNLVENAVAHAPMGTEVGATVYPDGGVSVSDRGPGVAPEGGGRGAAGRLGGALGEETPMTGHRQAEAKDHAAEALKRRVWVTRQGVQIDRIASAWLIRRFIDPEAPVKFVRAKGYAPEPDELRFDMYEGEFTHGCRCTFEVLLARSGLSDPALSPSGRSCTTSTSRTASSAETAPTASRSSSAASRRRPRDLVARGQIEYRHLARVRNIDVGSPCFRVELEAFGVRTQFRRAHDGLAGRVDHRQAIPIVADDQAPAAPVKSYVVRVLA